MSQRMLEGEVFIDTRDEAIRSLREESAMLRRQLIQAEQVIGQLRNQLQPLFQALQLVFGVIDEIAPPDGAAPMPQKNKAVWDAWKQRLGGLQAKSIDALLLHGGMTQTQLRIAVGCATGSVPNIVSALYKAGLITKRDGKIFLKEL